MDIEHLAIIRGNVAAFLAECGKVYGAPGRLLDIAPQDHEGAAPYFPSGVSISTLDINPQSGATYIADLCACNAERIPANHFDWVVCTEVLEHTLDPFAAAKEMFRILKPGGLAFVSVPFNFRIHGPLPDCWRFTEHGLRALFRDFRLVSLKELCTPGRDLMPIHYTVVAEKSVSV